MSEYDWDKAHEALESMDDYARMATSVNPYGPYAVLLDLLTKAKGWKEAADRAPVQTSEARGDVVARARVICERLRNQLGKFRDEMEKLRDAIEGGK